MIFIAWTIVKIYFLRICFLFSDAADFTISFTRRALYDMMRDCKGMKIDEKFDFLRTKLIEITHCPDNQRCILDRTLKYFKTEFKQKWVAASRKEERFLCKNEKWLTSSIQLQKFSAEVTHKQGRPTKPFENLSDRSKRRKTSEIRSQIPPEELVFAAGVSQRTAGNTDASVMIKEITASPNRASKIRSSYNLSQKQISVKKHTPQEALSIFVEGDFTRRQWEILYNANKSIYPCYSLLQKAKKDCYPKEEAIQVTETCIDIQLQGLLNHTASRLHKYLEEVIKTLSKEEMENLELISKWGCDGSQQSQFKQKFQNISDSDSNIFQSSLVPLRLIVNINDKIIWQNSVPSSVRFCRPIRIRFVSESKDITKEEIKYVNDQLKTLSKTEIIAPGGIVKIKHTMLFTMIDGKVCNAATDTLSTMRCYICGQTSKDFNNLKDVSNVNVEALQFGLSVLHARIRFFESLLHLAYKLPLKKWQARTPAEKKTVKETKERIQKDFREQMGLLVDVPKAGYGNTNDGNTSRRFFAEPDTSSRISGINVDLIKRFGVILEVVSSGFAINAEKFSTYAHTTAMLYVELYGWHPMSPTVHKILIHGAQVIRHAILPIGQLTEEAAEARNKNFRQYRIDFSRKFSREDCNRDIMNRLLLSSDPYLSSIRPKTQKKKKIFSKEALDLMIAIAPPSLADENTSCESDEENEDDEVYF